MSERKVKDAIFAPRETTRRARISWLPQAHKAPPSKRLGGALEHPVPDAPQSGVSVVPSSMPHTMRSHPESAPLSTGEPQSTRADSHEGKATVPTTGEGADLVPPPPLSSGALPIGSHAAFFADLPAIPPPPEAPPSSAVQGAMESFLQAADAISEIRSLRGSRVERDLVDLARAIAARVIGRELSTDPAILVALARDGIGALAERENVVVRFAIDVPEDIREQLTEAVAHRAPGCTVVFDPELVTGSCVVESAQGYVDESVGTRLDVVMEQLGFGNGGLE